MIEYGVKELDYFHTVEVNPLGRSELLSLWNEVNEKNEARVKLIEFFGMPEMPDIPQSYVGIVNAHEFVSKLLIDKEGNVKHGVFEENVRAFLGENNEVNSKIKNTLLNENKKKLFSVLNNGITVVAPELTVIPNLKEIDITNYQIINGCQTSNTLLLALDELDNDVNVVVKFIESPNIEVSADIIAATNSQSDVVSESFHGLKNKAKLVQSYFDAKNGSISSENKIYFERRENQYKHNGYQSTRIFSIRELARCYSAMFLNQPHLSARYVNNIFANSGDNLFKNDDCESLYYVSALTLYKYRTLLNGKRYAGTSFTKLKWHIILLFRWVVHGKIENINPTSRKADKYADKIIKILSSQNKEKYISYFEKCHEIITRIGFPTDAELKTQKFNIKLQETATRYLKENQKQ